jgi:hypothetical protein
MKKSSSLRVPSLMMISFGLRGEDMSRERERDKKGQKTEPTGILVIANAIRLVEEDHYLS